MSRSTSNKRKYCCVFGCRNNNYLQPGLSFFSIPTESERRLEWLELMGREDLLHKASNYRVCEIHFNPQHIKMNITRKSLLKNTFPCFHLPNFRKGDKQPQVDIITVNASSQTEIKWNDCSEDKSIYADDNERTADDDVDAESAWESYSCNECCGLIKGGRFACAQCVDYDLCAQCAGERAAHRQHYLLRVPPRRPPDEVDMVLQTIRSMLENSEAFVALPANESEDEDEETVSIKSEVIDEVEVFEEPLGCEVKQEVQEKGDNCETLKRPIPQSSDIKYMTKRCKQETRDVTSAPPVALQSSLVGGATAAADCTVVSAPVVKKEVEPSQQTFLYVPVLPRPPKPAVTNTSSPTRASILVTRPTSCAGQNNLVAKVPEAAVDWPGETLQTVPDTPAGTSLVPKHNLDIENMQIHVAGDQSDKEEDVQQVSDRAQGSTSKS